MHIIIREINQITIAIAPTNVPHNIVTRRSFIKIDIAQQATEVGTKPGDAK